MYTIQGMGFIIMHKAERQMSGSINLIINFITAIITNNKDSF